MTTSTLDKSDAVPPAAGRANVAAGAWRASWRFYVCLGLLATTALTMQGLAAALGQYFRKQAAPLLKPLAAADQRRLSPEYTLHPVPPEPINHEVLETLGTEEYLSWRIVDTRRAKDDPLALAHVFVTYYTGKPDMVPHVPDECYRAGGAVAVGTPRTVKIPAAGVRAPGEQVPVRVVTFQPKQGLRTTGQPMQINILYFFHCNGRYVTTRDDVRFAQANLFDRYAYYAKVELNFTDYEGRKSADFDSSVKAAGPLLEKLMPILLEDHFPDWDALSRSGAAAEAGKGEGS